MIYSMRSVALSEEKYRFFHEFLVNNQNTQDTQFQSIDACAKKKGHTFVLGNKKSLEDELLAMMAILQQQNDNNKEIFWFYCYYCASLLETFYNAYSQSGNAAKYTTIKQQIKDRLKGNGVNKKSTDEDSFIQSVQHSFLEGFRNLIHSPFHVSQIRDYVAYSNLCRVYWVFCRLTLTQGLTVARDLKLIDKLDVLLGSHTDIDKIIKAIQAPTFIINYFSVGLFLVRLMIDGGLLLKHTFFPTELEKGAARFDRFKHELYKRHCNFANDLVWATVNFLTNFNQVVHISGPVAGYITSVFLVFDVAMVLYQCNLAKQEYLTKKAQYINERDNPEFVQQMTDDQKLMHIEMLNKQLITLEINWRAKEAMFYFVAAAATLLMLGFTASLIVNPAVLVVGCYFVCTVAIAMYLSAGSYCKYQEKSLSLEQAQLTGAHCSLAMKEYEAVRNDFAFTMTKNTVMPLVLITTFATCWPAALVLTAMYMGYEMYHAYDQHSENKAINQLALNSFP